MDRVDLLCGHGQPFFFLQVLHNFILKPAIVSECIIIINYTFHKELIFTQLIMFTPILYIVISQAGNYALPVWPIITFQLLGPIA